MTRPDLYPLLAIDTSTSAGFVALVLNQNVTYSKKIEITDSHNENLAVVVSDLLEKAACTPQNLVSIFFGGGPGSFTGLRIGASFVSGLLSGIAAKQHKPAVLYVSQSLEVFARGVLQTHPDLNVVSITADARRDEVYGFSINKDRTELYPLGIYPSNFAFEDSHSPDSLDIEDFLSGVLDLFFSDFSQLNQYTSDSIADLEMYYLREVAARTIEERNQIKTLTKGSDSSLK